MEYDEIPPIYDYQRYTGHTIGTPILYVAEGLYTPDDFYITKDPVTGAESYTLKEGLPNPGAQVAPGDIKYKDLNNDGIIDGYDRTYNHGFGSQDPQLVYGIAIDLEYKGFFAGIFFQGTEGTSVNLMAKASNFMPFNQGKDASSARMEAMSRWTASNPYNQNVLYPRLHSSNFSYNLYESLDGKYLTFIEEWKDEKAIETHNNSDHFKSIVPKIRELTDGEMDTVLYKEVK